MQASSIESQSGIESQSSLESLSNHMETTPKQVIVSPFTTLHVYHDA